MPDKVTPNGEQQLPNTRAKTGQEIAELQRMEAEWIWQEMEDSVKLIQQYRGLYVTAIFLSLGWLLGQVVGAYISATSIASNGQSQPFSLELMRYRTDIAVLLCAVALINLLFMMLMVEQATQMRSLARYRFILGIELGAGKPVWRWERWKETREGSTRAWTNPLNLLFFLVGVILTISALLFPFPAVWGSGSITIWAIWIFTASVLVILTAVGISLGFRYRHRNAVADDPIIHWSDLGDRSASKK